MSIDGVRVDVAILRDLEETIGKRLAKVEHKIFDLAGHNFNINSSQQVASVLFQELDLPSGKKTKTGFSTDESTLRKIKKLHPIVSLILKYRSLYKLISTYLHSLQEHTDKTGKIHSTFLSDVASTGRLVSKNPNLQNIPIRGEWGYKIRKAFVAGKNCFLVAVDYSQIDLRVLAHFSQDPKLLEAFVAGRDVHLETAMEIFNKKQEDITHADRQVAKTVNFGIIYGMSAHGLSETLEIDQKQAAYFIETYFKKYPMVKDYLEKSKQFAVESGYSTTLGGHKRHIPELKSDNHYMRKSGERMAINHPIQGSAAEIIELAMVAIDEKLKKKKLSSYMILQIHDELLFEVVEREKQSMTSMIKLEMENIVKLDVPLLVTIKIGKNWGEMKSVS